MSHGHATQVSVWATASWSWKKVQTVFFFRQLQHSDVMSAVFPYCSHPSDHVTGFLDRMMDVLIGIFGVSAAGPNGILNDRYDHTWPDHKNRTQ